MVRDAGRARGPQVIAIAAVAALTAGVGALSLHAYAEANPTVPRQTAAPVPSFTLGVQTPTPTATPEPSPTAAASRADERFLSSASGTLWRAVAGACGGAAPRVERSNDGGLSWSDVTPLYLGVAQLSSLDGLAVDAAEAVGAVGGCQPQALRSYTNGRYWDTYPDVLAISRYVDPGDASIVHLSTGPVAAPCAEARGLRAAGSTVALVCDGVPYVRSAEQWVQLPATGAQAVAVSGEDVLVAHIGDGCSGLTLTAFGGGDPGRPSDSGCAEVPDPFAPVAVAVASGQLLVWSGDAVVTVP